MRERIKSTLRDIVLDENSEGDENGDDNDDGNDNGNENKHNTNKKSSTHSIRPTRKQNHRRHTMFLLEIPPSKLCDITVEELC
jgi:hypothetical protein